MSFISELRRRNVFRVAIAYTVTGWLVAQVAELALDSFEAPDWVMKTILLVLVLGLPFAVLFAWAFELTPEGLKREKDVDRSASITQQTGQKLNLAIIGILVVALGFSLATRDWGQSPESTTPSTGEQATTEKSIAVLPFVNMSDDPSNEYFSDGISEELLNVLVKVEGLRVASRTSAFSFKGKDTPIPEIAKALNVDHVLEGSVRKAGETVRVTAQLIDVRTDSHLWSETYDRKLEDIFVIQDEISGHIVEALKVALGTGSTAYAAEHATENLEAYQDYLKARYFWQRRGEDNILKAIDLFENATSADPGFARAWAGLATAHITLPVYSTRSPDLHFPLAAEHANHALSIDPTIADAYAVLGDIARQDKDYITAEQHFRKAIELEPKNATSHLWYTEHLMILGRIEPSLKHINIALQLDPLGPGTNAVASAVYESIDDQEARARFDRSAWELGHLGALADLIDTYVQARAYEKARQVVLENSEALGPDFRQGMLGYIEAYQDPSIRSAFLESASRSAALAGRPWYIVVPLTHWGDLDGAYDVALSTEPGLNALMDVWRSDMGAFRKDPRFSQIIEKAGWAPYWDRYGMPAWCSRDGEHIVCN
jgi:TolB-like protein